MEILSRVYLKNSVENWLLAAAIGLGIAIGLMLVRKFLNTYLIKLKINTGQSIVEFFIQLVRATKWPFLLGVGCIVALDQLVIKSIRVEKWISHAWIILLMLQVLIWGNRIIRIILQHNLEKYRESNHTSVTSIAVIGFVARLLLWITVILLTLDNLGFNITTLIAGLGVGGVAVALAVQNILGDLFASLSIAFDKPFVVGDFVAIGKDKGTVEYVGLKTTRLTSLDGEQIIFSNADLLRSRIHNYKRMQERRVEFNFNLPYQTPIELLEKIPGWVQKIIEEQPDTRFESAHFKNFGNSALEFEAVYYVLQPAYILYRNRQQAINLNMLKLFAQQGIEFFYMDPSPAFNPVVNLNAADFKNPAQIKNPASENLPELEN